MAQQKDLREEAHSLLIRLLVLIQRSESTELRIDLFSLALLSIVVAADVDTLQLCYLLQDLVLL